MSGPIIRKYGFPNFENIFGKRDLEHGVDRTDADKAKDAETPAADPAAKPNGAEPTAPPSSK